MNNAVYFELIDTAVNAHLAEATGVDIRSLPAIGVVAEVSCRYFREIGYPEPVDLGMVVDKVGTSSVIYRIGLFQGDPEGAGAEAAAEGRFVHVYVDNTGGRSEGAGQPDARPGPRGRRTPAAGVTGPCLNDGLRVTSTRTDTSPTKEPPWEPSWSCCCSRSRWLQSSCCTSPTPTAARRPPLTPLLGEAMRRGVESLPTLDPESGRPRGPYRWPAVVDAQADAHR